MTAQDILNYYLTNPPFEITDKIKYAEFLQFQADMTMIELSENKPIMSESTFTTPAATGSEEYIHYDLTEIHEKIMELVVLDTTANIVPTIQGVCTSSLYGVQDFTSTSIDAAIKSGSLTNMIAMQDYQAIIEEWFRPRIQNMLYDGKYIKLLPETEYYAMYRRYKTMNELQQTEMRTFQRLVNMNVMLAIYQSDTFASEGGIRSVSLSGLSVSFNVPEAAGKVRDLQHAKIELLSSMALDYSDGCVGLI